MKIIPAVDIKEGKCAQLIGGREGTEKFYGNPLEMAEKWVSEGAEILHVIDLDSALGTGDNTEIVLNIVNSIDAEIQVGGGIRSLEKAELLLNSGVKRIILGTLAFSDARGGFPVLSRLNEKFGEERIMVALDSRDGEIVIKGWQESTGNKAWEIAPRFESLVWGFLYTDVDVEGKMEGINLSGVEEVIGATKLPVQVSGGISSNEDIKNLKDIGAWGIVLGKALYERKIETKGFL